MFYRLLFLQVITHLTCATPREASLVDTNHAQPNMIKDADLGVENEADLFRESIQSTGEGNSNGLIVGKMSAPQGNFARSSPNEGQSAVCSNPQTVRDCGTTITESGTILRSPITSNFSLLYPPSTDCKWNVEAPVGMNITVVTLCEFVTASSTQSTSNCSEDYIEFKPSDGRDVRICGGYSSFSYNTPVNLLTIRFRSNSDSKVGRGFVIRIDFVKESQPDICYDPQTFLDCGATITQSDTILRSPINGNNNLLYPASKTCKWNVTAPPGADIHVVSLCQFGTAPLSDTSLCFEDYLEFMPSNGKRYKVCGGLTSFSFNTTSGSNKLSIRFRSDSDDKVGRGFVAKIIFSDGIEYNYGRGLFHCGTLLMTLSVLANVLLFA